MNYLVLMLGMNKTPKLAINNFLFPNCTQRINLCQFEFKGFIKLSIVLFIMTVFVRRYMHQITTAFLAFINILNGQCVAFWYESWYELNIYTDLNDEGAVFIGGGDLFRTKQFLYLGDLRCWSICNAMINLADLYICFFTIHPTHSHTLFFPKLLQSLMSEALVKINNEFKEQETKNIEEK